MNYYVYAYLDPRKPGIFSYDDILLGYEPFYVGLGQGKRMSAGLDSKHNNILKKRKISSIKKSGHSPIAIKIKDGLSSEQARELEFTIINLIGRIFYKTGPLTNISDGGLNGHPHTEEWKAVLSKPVLQFTKSDELVAEFNSIKAAALSLNLHQQNIGACCAGKYKSTGGFVWKYKNNNDAVTQGHTKIPYKGKAHAESTKAKISASAKKGDDHPMKKMMGGNHAQSKKIMQYELDGTPVKLWESLNDIVRYLGGGGSQISRCCNGKLHKTKGFIWKFV